ncbi:helix-turn-helix transcriptional regulator [Amorphus sp. 3PC139-8]|uniref:helix-turn-helix transcriptional regulator n=1 Tax=Amorphus sp. 3PC139-8 TaxID=2735676 RepID=UPI00345C6422
MDRTDIDFRDRGHADDDVAPPTSERAFGRNSVLSGRELSQAASHGSPDYAILSPNVGPNDDALAGRYLLSDLRPGLTLHATDTVELHDLTTQVTQEPGLTCHLILEGEVDFQLDGHLFSLTGTGGPRPAPQGQLIFQPEPADFVRRSRRDTHIRKVCVTATVDWLETSDAELSALLDRVADTGLAHAIWTPSAHAVALAEQILNPPGLDGFLGRLYLECRATSLLLEALKSLTEAGHETPAALRPRDRRRVQSACDYLEAHLSDPISLPALARQVGASVSTLQRLFQSVYGMSVFGYLRERRLLKARFALEIGEANVAQAATLAGYTSPANFATAFKRRFGTTPSEMRGAPVETG